MPVDITFRIGGSAGQGMQIISYPWQMLVRGGYYVFATQDVMSRVRGGHNFASVRVCDRPVYAQHERCDVLVALDERTIEEHRNELVEHGVVVHEKKLSRPVWRGRRSWLYRLRNWPPGSAATRAWPTRSRWVQCSA